MILCTYSRDVRANVYNDVKQDKRVTSSVEVICLKDACRKVLKVEGGVMFSGCRYVALYEC